MGWPTCNTTAEFETIEEDPVWRGMTFHRFGLIVSASFALIAVLTSCYLIWRHASHYYKPWEQRHIIRVLFMVPIYATVSFLSYFYYRHAVYFEVVRDCYEAFAIASFFGLLCHYTAPDLHSQKDYFRTLRPRGWVLPLSWFKKCCGGEKGICRTPRSGLTWFNIIWFGVFQYCFVRVFMTLVALVTQATGRYCLESLNPAFAHVWVMVIEGGCVTIAMYCLIQFYIQLKHDLAEHRPLLKVAAIKLVVFLSFWQTLLISFLTSTGVIKPSKRFVTPDIKVGIPSFLLCIEMAIFSVFHLWAFPWNVYDIRRSHIVASESLPGYLPDPKTAYQGGWLGFNALMDAFNPWDLVKAVGRGFKWFAVGRRTREQDISYKSSVPGTGLEPIRSPAPTTSNNFNSNDLVTTRRDETYHYSSGKPVRYRPLGEGEEEKLLSHAQVMPQSGPYSRSDRSELSKKEKSAIDISTMNRFSQNPDHRQAVHSPPKNSYKHHGAEDTSSREPRAPNPALGNQDIGHHGAQLPPAASNPYQNRSSSPSQLEEEWKVWSGSQRERDGNKEADGARGVDLGERGTRNGDPF